MASSASSQLHGRHCHLLLPLVEAVHPQSQTPPRGRGRRRAAICVGIVDIVAVRERRGRRRRIRHHPVHPLAEVGHEPGVRRHVRAQHDGPHLVHEGGAHPRGQAHREAVLGVVHDGRDDVRVEVLQGPAGLLAVQGVVGVLQVRVVEPEVAGVVAERRHVQRQHVQVADRPVPLRAHLRDEAVRRGEHVLRVQLAVVGLVTVLSPHALEESERAFVADAELAQQPSLAKDRERHASKLLPSVSHPSLLLLLLLLVLLQMLSHPIPLPLAPALALTLALTQRLLLLQAGTLVQRPPQPFA
mmetsp:Transcript_36591/g.90307  ORF Transcript_36591/g.90307 Transcript_36591/m.90307 type:complete len:300 (-) Transcript_36591:298-1197(-)